MAFHVRDKETDALVRELARKKGVGLTEAVKQAVSAELSSAANEPSLHQRIMKIVEPLAAYPETGLGTDKQFLDDLSGS